MNEGLNFEGYLELEVIKNDGTIEVIKSKNMIMDQGKNAVSNILLGNSPSGQIIPMFFAVGTDPTISNSSMTALVTALGARKALQSKSTSWKSLVYQFQSVSGEHVGTWKEIGLFGSTGTTASMFSRANISPVVKGGSDEINGTWRITI